MQTNKDGVSPQTPANNKNITKSNIHSDQPPLLGQSLQLLFRRKARALTQRLKVIAGRLAANGCMCRGINWYY